MTLSPLTYVLKSCCEVLDLSWWLLWGSLVCKITVNISVLVLCSYHLSPSFFSSFTNCSILAGCCFRLAALLCGLLLAWLARALFPTHIAQISCLSMQFTVAFKSTSLLHNPIMKHRHCKPLLLKLAWITHDDYITWCVVIISKATLNFYLSWHYLAALVNYTVAMHIYKAKISSIKSVQLYTIKCFNLETPL